MDGKRFGVGLAAGILLGLAVISASGGLSAGTPYFAPVSAGTTTQVLTTTTTISASTTSGTAGSAQSSISSTPLQSGNQTNETRAVSSTSTALSSHSSVPYSAGLGQLASALPSSRISNVATQPVLSNAIVSIPMVMAVILGALLYRASIRNRDEHSDEQPSPDS